MAPDGAKAPEAEVSIVQVNKLGARAAARLECLEESEEKEAKPVGELKTATTAYKLLAFRVGLFLKARQQLENPTSLKFAKADIHQQECPNDRNDQQEFANPACRNVSTRRC